MENRTPERLDRNAVEQGFALALGLPILSVHITVSRAWASITFDGYRVRMTVRGEVDPDALEEMAFPIPGYIVADVEMTGAGDGARQLDALLVREA